MHAGTTAERRGLTDRKDGGGVRRGDYPNLKANASAGQNFQTTPIITRSGGDNYPADQI